MKLTRTTAPDADPVALSEVRAWLNMVQGITEDDSVLELLVDEAYDWLEVRTNRKFLNQTWTAVLDYSEVSSCIRLPLVPLVSISSIKTTDDAGTVTTVGSTNYQVRAGEDPRITLTSTGAWPSDMREYDAMEITAVCGYNGATLPIIGYVPTDPHNPGLDDAKAAPSDTWAGTARTKFELAIDTTGSTDKFKWRMVTRDSNNTKTYGSWTTGVSITGSAQALSTYKVTVTFGAQTGHTLSDAWTIQMVERLPDNIRSILRAIIQHTYDSKGSGLQQTVSGQLYGMSRFVEAKIDSLRVIPL